MKPQWSTLIRQASFLIGIAIGLTLNLSYTALLTPSSAQARPAPPCTYQAPIPLDADPDTRPVCLDDWIRNLDFLYQNMWVGSPGYVHESSGFPVLHDWGSNIGGYWIQDDQGRQCLLDVIHWMPMDFTDPALVAALDPTALANFQSVNGEGGIVIGRFWSAITSQTMGVIAVLSSGTDGLNQRRTVLIPLDTVSVKVLDAIEDSLFVAAATPPFGVPWCECSNRHQFSDDEITALNNCGSVIDAVYQTCSVNYAREFFVTAIAVAAALFTFALCSGLAPAAFTACMKAAIVAHGLIVSSLSALIITHIFQCINERDERRKEACTRACLGLPPC